MRRFWDIESLILSERRLTVSVVELQDGPSDGSIGLPLIATESSLRYRVSFESFGTFQAVPEPLTVISSEAEELHPFLYREPQSELLSKWADGTVTFNFGKTRTFDQRAMHYVVFSESYVLNVLATAAPVVTSAIGSPNPPFQRTAARPLN